MNDIDQTAQGIRCGQAVERYAGEPDSEYMTPYWRHTDRMAVNGHPAVPDPDSVQEVDR